MSLIDWFNNLPPASLTDPGIKMLIYLIIVFTFLSAIVVFFTTRVYRKKEGPSLLDLSMESDLPTPSDIPASERIAILQIEKVKFIAGQRALSDSHKRKEISEQIFGRLSVRYASDVKKIEEEIEKTTREAEVSQLEEELKKMQGDYLSKIKGEETIETAPPAPVTAPPAPPTVDEPAKPPKKEKPPKKKKKEKAVVTPPAAPPMPGKAAPPPPPGVTVAPPGTSIPAPPTPIPIPTGPTTTPAIPAPTVPTPKPPGTGAPPTAPATGEGEGDLFAKSTSIAALRKEMLKELDRLKKFMSEQ